MSITVLIRLLRLYFESSKKDVPEEWNKINPLYKDMLGRIIENGDVEYKALPNVKQLLAKCAESSDFDLALVTGNLAHCAELKLKSAGIDTDLFKRAHNGERKLIGGFGEDDIYRPGMGSDRRQDHFFKLNCSW